jgi:hypothetical protein
MGNSPGYRGNPALHAARARFSEQQAADLAAAEAALARAQAEADEAARIEADAALVLPATRRIKASPKSEQETP